MISTTKWKKLFTVVSLFVVPVMGAAAQTDSGYSVIEVKELLKQPSGFSSSFSEKQVNRLGDRISIALMKIYSQDDLKDPRNIKRYLPLITDAFRFPQLVAAEDREPRITLVLLEFLQGQVRDKTLQAEILKTKKTVVEEATLQK